MENSAAWTFAGTVRVDGRCHPWDDSKDLVEIAKGKSKEAKGASERSDAIEYRELTGFFPRIDWIFSSSTSKRYLKS